MLRHPRRTLLALALAATTAAPLHAQAAPRATAPDRAVEPAFGARFQPAAEEARTLLSRLRSAEAIPAISVAVLHDGQVVWSDAWGYADLESRTPASPLTRFRIASISKPVTAAAVGLLVQQGRLDLDRPVQAYVRGYPEQRWPVTTRQVAGHLGGIRHYDGDEMLSARRYGSVREAVGIFERDSLRAEPGTTYLYSSYGFNLVSAVVEGAAGEPFLGYLRRQILEPLGLRSLTAEHTDSLIPWRARFYDRGADGRVTNAPYVDNSNKWAGGGFLSNAEDLVRFGWAHVDGGLLTPETVALLTTSQRLRSGEPTNYGIGWATGADSAALRWFGHTGGAVGGRSVLLVYPEQRVVVAILANLGQAPMTTELAGRVAAPFIAAARAGR